MSSLRTLPTCGALERRRPETFPVTLIRTTNLDIVKLNTLLRQFTECCERELAKRPQNCFLDFIISLDISNDTTTTFLLFIFISETAYKHISSVYT